MTSLLTQLAMANPTTLRAALRDLRRECSHERELPLDHSGARGATPARTRAPWCHPQRSEEVDGPPQHSASLAANRTRTSEDREDAMRFILSVNVRVTGDLRQELAKRADAARRPC